MGFSEETLLIILFGVLYDVTPVVLIWGWIRWIWRAMSKGSDAILSLVSLVLATASALVAASLILYDQLTHAFAYYDPRKLLLFQIGALLSVAAVMVGIGAVFGGRFSRSNCLRWHAPVSALGTLAFWICAALGK